MENVKIIQPKKFQNVGRYFEVEGQFPVSWFKDSFGIDNYLSVELIDLKGQTIYGTSIKNNNDFKEKNGKVHFLCMFYFSEFNVGFIKESQGRMTIRLSGKDDNKDFVYIPIIVKQLEPKFGTSLKIIRKHKKIGQLIEQYKKDLKKYYNELEKIQERKLEKNAISKEDYYKMDQFAGDPELVGGIIQSIGKPWFKNFRYPFRKEEREEKRLVKKYKNALEWQGPMIGVAVGKTEGFEICIYNNDHDKHFHILHKGRGVNARFSFPELELINYKHAKTSIRSREKKKIIKFLKEPEIFNRLKNEFARRDELN